MSLQAYTFKVNDYLWFSGEYINSRATVMGNYNLSSSSIFLPCNMGCLTPFIKSYKECLLPQPDQVFLNVSTCNLFFFSSNIGCEYQFSYFRLVKVLGGAMGKSLPCYNYVAPHPQKTTLILQKACRYFFLSTRSCFLILTLNKPGFAYLSNLELL